MLEIRKHYVLDENQHPIAVQIAIADFEQIEEILEDFGLVKLMEAALESRSLSKADALEYYRSLKEQTVTKETQTLLCERIAHRREIYRFFP